MLVRRHLTVLFGAPTSPKLPMATAFSKSMAWWTISHWAGGLGSTSASKSHHMTGQGEILPHPKRAGWLQITYLAGGGVCEQPGVRQVLAHHL